jgi:hypothetical protein
MHGFEKRNLSNEVSVARLESAEAFWRSAGWIAVEFFSAKSSRMTG